jgi:hypothetical protein
LTQIREETLNADEQILISTAGKAPTTLEQHHDGAGIVLWQQSNRIVLSGDELARLIAAVEKSPTTTTPSKARLIAYPVDD